VVNPWLKIFKLCGYIKQILPPAQAIPLNLAKQKALSKGIVWHAERNWENKYILTRIKAFGKATIPLLFR